jgi:hypothetical protein
MLICLSAKLSVRDYLGILEFSEDIKNPEAVDLQQLPVCAGNRT